MSDKQGPKMFSPTGRAVPRVRTVIPWDVRTGGQTGQREVRVLRAVHESFARVLEKSWGEHLRAALRVTLSSVEQISYEESLQRLPQESYFASILVESEKTPAALRLDLSLVWAIIDLSLGGAGKGADVFRDLTEIEEEVLASPLRELCNALEEVWEPLFSVKLELEGGQPRRQFQRLLPAAEKVLCLGFEVRFPETQGMFHVVVPAGVTGLLLRKTGQARSPLREKSGVGGAARMRGHLLRCRFPLELALPPSLVRGSELLSLKPGQVLVLQQKVDDPAIVYVVGKGMFTAHPVRSGNLRGAQVQQRLRLAPKYERESP